MPNYHQYLMRHGEHGVQALIERIERYEGIRANIILSLEERWAHLMQPNSMAQSQLQAA
jgi:hypothetical protein